MSGDNQPETVSVPVTQQDFIREICDVIGYHKFKEDENEP